MNAQQTTLDLSSLPTCEQAFWQVIHTYNQRLTDEQETLLTRRARREKEARNDLLIYLLSRVAHFARRYARIRNCLHRVDDFMGEASVAILSCMDHALDETSNPIGYLRDMACHAIRATVYADGLIVTPYEAEPIPVLSLEAPLDNEDGFTLADTLEDTNFHVEINKSAPGHGALHDAIRTLPDRDRQIIVRHFGLYVNAPESLADILRSFGLSEKNKPMRRILTKLCMVLKNAYPQYCSPTRETRRPASVSQKPLRPEEVQQLRAAQERLQANGTPLSIPNLRRESGIGINATQRYVRLLKEQGEIPQVSQEVRLNTALAEMQARSENISSRKLACIAHVDESAARLYLIMHSCPMKSRTVSDQPPVERLQESYDRLLAQGGKVTATRLREEAHVDNNTARAFFREKQSCAVLLPA